MRRRVTLGVLLLAASFSATSHAEPPAPIEVQVVGELLPRASDEAALSSTRLTRDELSRPGQSLADALARVPGALVVRTGGAGELATVTLRGGSSAQTPVYVAGVRLNDDFTGTADLSAIPISMLRSVEVYRGQAPLFLDRSGLTGAVMLEPELSPGTSQGRLRTEIGSFGARSFQAAANFGNAQASALVAATVSRSDNDFDYIDDRGTLFDESDDVPRTRENADVRQASLWASGRLKLGRRGSLISVFSTSVREQGVPGLALIPARKARSEQHRSFYAARVTSPCENRSENCALEFSSFAKRSFYVLTDPERELPVFGTRQQIEGLATGYAARLLSDPWACLGLELGVRQSLERHRIEAEGSREVSATRLSSKLFASAAFTPLEWLTLSAAGAVSLQDTRQNTGNEAPASALPLSPNARVGVTVTPLDGWSARLLGAYDERTPTLGERYGASALILGNSTLRPESGPSVELGTRYERDFEQVTLAADAAGYARFAQDLISYRRSAAGVLRPYNVGRARVLGVELAAEARFFERVTASGMLSLSDPRDVSDDARTDNDLLPFQAVLTSAAGLGVVLLRTGAAEWLSDLGLSSRFSYRSRRVADSAGLIALPDQVNLDAELSAGLFNGLSRLRFAVNNMLADDSTDVIGYPLPGRAFHLALEGSYP